MKQPVTNTTGFPADTASSNYSLKFDDAAMRLKNIVTRTPLQLNIHLSRKYQCNVYLKREDLQVVRSYKLRGAYNMMSSLPKEQLVKGVVCASAGNHAQGFAYSCKKLNVKGVIFMPVITPRQKVNQTKMFGEDNIEVKLIGDTFDDCAIAAKNSPKKIKWFLSPPSMIPVSLKARERWLLKF
jgi:threonine dehydratase